MVTLNIAETFYSIQGEGMFTGRPSWFIRLAGCPVACRWCDTTEVWKNTKEAVAQDNICDWVRRTTVKLYPRTMLNDWLVGYPQKFIRPARIVFTGGEPLWGPNRDVIEWLLNYQQVGMFPFNSADIEIETSGCYRALADHTQYSPRWTLYHTVSPKPPSAKAQLQLSIPTLVEKVVTVRPSRLQLKLPVQVSVDTGELDGADMAFASDYVAQYRAVMGCWPASVSIMPVCSSRASLLAASPAIAKFCLEQGFNFSSRLQLAIWDQTTGV